MFKRIDESKLLSKFLAYISSLLAKRRGLPIVVGIVLVVVSFVLQVINVSAKSDFVELVGVIVHNAGVLIALLGLTLAIPLGK